MVGATEKPFENILNFRDVGKTINQLAGRNLILPGKLYRSARPDEASGKDREVLVDQYGITTVVDLRTDTELNKQAGKIKPKRSYFTTVLDSLAFDLWPNRIPNINYKRANINGDPYTKALTAQLTWSEYFALISNYISGYRIEAIAVIGRAVLQPLGLRGLATSTLSNSVDDMRIMFEFLADEQGYPLLVHCTQGKDRTGLIVMLVLFYIEVDIDIINQEYMMSEKELEPEREERLEEIRSIGLGDEFASCDPGLVVSIKKYLDDRFGGIEAYLDIIGVTKDMRHAIKTNLAAQGL